ncbi:GRAS transcription factor [Trema orientale]|uniref:GRAS transcription factor n=1 Tax=Trema orientale TaxID=63057 RepID=A0A2P5EIF5_TREOI|nr:GRAS transcription factor [Trema orientale]
MADIHRLLSKVYINGERTKEVGDHELSLSAMACYPFPYMPLLENRGYTLILPFPDENREHKRIKRVPSLPESISSSATPTPYRGGGNINDSNDTSNSCISRCSSTSSLSSMPSLQFRDHILTYTQRYLAAEVVEEAAEAIMGANQENRGIEDGEADEMRLVQLLIACAEAVACRDKSHASVLLSELRANALVFGSSFQRVASCFVQGLADRLAMVHPLGAVGFIAPAPPPTMSIMDVGISEKKEEALRLVYEICPHIQFGHFVANASILEAFEEESFVHVVDLGMTLGLPHGHQWRALIQSLADRATTHQPPRRLRITAVGLCDERFRIIGDELELFANNLGVNLEFSVVKTHLENLSSNDIKTSDDEVLAVNSILQLHCVVKESRGALNSVLQTIHELGPKVLVLVEQDSSHNGPFFLGRFMEALHYYSAIFDSLDAMLPKYDTRRAKMEQFYFAEEIKNIISCEGPARVERHERVDQWRRRMSRAGFQAGPIKMMAQAKQWLAQIEACEGYTIVEEKGCLVLGWKSRPIVAASCWKC